MAKKVRPELVLFPLFWFQSELLSSSVSGSVECWSQAEGLKRPEAVVSVSGLYHSVFHHTHTPEQWCSHVVAMEMVCDCTYTVMRVSCELRHVGKPCLIHHVCFHIDWNQNQGRHQQMPLSVRLLGFTGDCLMCHSIWQFPILVIKQCSAVDYSVSRAATINHGNNH